MPVAPSRGHTNRGAGYCRAMNSASLPVVALTGLGVLVVLIGFFVAGNVTYVLIGLGAIAVAGVLHVVDRKRQ